jgi:hypothetical protein
MHTESNFRKIYSPHHEITNTPLVLHVAYSYGATCLSATRVNF